MEFLYSLVINLPVSNICIGKTIKLYLGKIKKKEKIKIYDKYNIEIKFEFFESLIEVSMPIKEQILITIKGIICKG